MANNNSLFKITICYLEQKANNNDCEVAEQLLCICVDLKIKTTPSPISWSLALI